MEDYIEIDLQDENLKLFIDVGSQKKNLQERCMTLAMLQNQRL